jgi:hypothetical protein
VIARADVWIPGLILGAALAFVIRPVLVGPCLLPAQLKSFIVRDGQLVPTQETPNSKPPTMSWSWHPPTCAQNWPRPLKRTGQVTGGVKLTTSSRRWFRQGGGHWRTTQLSY